MNQRLIGREIFWAAALILFFWVASMLLRRLQLMVAVEYGLAGVLLAAVPLLHVMFGVLLGLPWLFERWDTHTGFNWSKLLVQGLPALVLAIPTLLIMRIFDISEAQVSYLPWEVMKNHGPGQFVVYLASVWFGKVLVDSAKGFKRPASRRNRSTRFRPPPKIGWS
ncbi:MAG: hypothetical protein AB1402_04330 [Bacillota bacterium]|jgi:hypothetical protein